MAQKIIEVADLKKYYNGGAVHAMDGVTVDICRGDVIAVIGPSGGGKSTFLRSLNLLEVPTAGSIKVDGVEITGKKVDLPRHRQKMGMVFQHFNLFPHMTVLRNMTLAPIKLKGKTREKAEEQAMELLGKVGLADRANAYPDQLSGGQKQRVAIAGVIAMRPDCLVLDESTAMLDPHGRSQVMKTIRQLREAGITIVSITHYMEEAAQADRVLVMSRGRIVMEGTPEQVFSQTERLHSYHLDVPQAAEMRDELVKLGIPMPENVITPEACAEELFKLLK